MLQKWRPVAARSHAWRYLGSSAFRPRAAPDARADGSSRSLLYRLLPVRSSSGNCQDLPSSGGTLMTIRPVLRPRWDRIRGSEPRVNVPGMAPAPKTTRAPTVGISGLDHTAFGLAVYASQCGLPATTQDSLPVAGPSFTGRDSTRRVPMKCSHSILLIRASWRDLLERIAKDPRCRMMPHESGRVALGVAPRAPTDPDVQISRIRFFNSRVRYAAQIKSDGQSVHWGAGSGGTGVCSQPRSSRRGYHVG